MKVTEGIDGNAAAGPIKHKTLSCRRFIAWAKGPKAMRKMAERVGFEPTIPVLARIPLFESGAFSHSATSPQDTGCL